MYKLVVYLLFFIGLGYFLYSSGLIAKFQDYITLKHMAHLTSSAFVDNALMPSLYTCDGTASNPPLDITDVVGNAQSLVLIVDDPDAPGKTYTHWVVFNIAPNTTNIPEKSVPVGSVQGVSSGGNVGYDAPCPPSGVHRYVFTLYVLDTTLSLTEGATKEEVLTAMQGHIIDKTQLTGRYMKSS